MAFAAALVATIAPEPEMLTDRPVVDEADKCTLRISDHASVCFVGLAELTQGKKRLQAALKGLRLGKSMLVAKIRGTKREFAASKPAPLGRPGAYGRGTVGGVFRTIEGLSRAQQAESVRRHAAQRDDAVGALERGKLLIDQRIANYEAVMQKVEEFILELK